MSPDEGARARRVTMREFTTRRLPLDAMLPVFDPGLLLDVDV
jgi:hypothetical protein